MKVSKNLSIIGALFIVILLSGVTWVFASGGGTIYACADSAGMLRVVSGPDGCGSQETSLYWSVTGPKGNKGNQGDPGPKGNPGVDGLSCWDLNGNGAADLNEDVNHDGTIDAFDCQGPKGDPGLEGPAGSIDLATLCDLETRIHATNKTFEFSPNCVTDADGDGYTNQTDCRDDLAIVHPGQQAWFSKPIDGTFDYDCSGYIEREWGTVLAHWTLIREYSCGVFAGACRDYESFRGWHIASYSDIPDCSQTAKWHDGGQELLRFKLEPSLYLISVDRTKEQRCH